MSGSTIGDMLRRFRSSCSVLQALFTAPVATENPDRDETACELQNRVMIPLHAGYGCTGVWLAVVAAEFATAAPGRESGAALSVEHSASAGAWTYAAIQFGTTFVR